MSLFTYDSWGVSSTGFDTSHTFVSSHFVSPVVLASIRAILCIYSFTTIIICYTYLANKTATVSLKDVNIGSYTVQQGSAAIGQSFSFFTYLTFWCLGFYFLFASVHTFMYASKTRSYLHNAFPRPLQLAHSLYYSTITSFPFLVTVVFWGTMNSGWPAGRFEQWINISVHGLNSVFAIVEIILPATRPQPWNHLSVILAVLSVYLGLAYLTRETQGFYVYEWMNPAHGNTSIILHIAGYAGSMIFFFMLSRFTIVARNNVAKRFGSSKENREIEKEMDSDDASEAWASEITIVTPPRAKLEGEYVV